MEQQQQHSSDDREEGSSSPGIASYEYMHPIDENLKCPICHSAFLVPYMSRTCEHVYCHQCIVAHLTSSSTVGVDENGDSATTTTCPCDRTPLRLDDPQSGGHSGQLVPAPRIVKLLCDELQVACTAPGCTWTGQRADWDRHARVDCLSAREESQSAAKDAAAATTSTACNHGCGARLASKGDLEKHEQEECIRRSVKCIMCEEKVVLVDMQDHAEACPYSEIACPQCNNGMFDRLSLVHHLEVDCASTVIACPHARFGCPARDARSVMLEQHVPSECAYEPLKGHLHASEDRLASLERENRELSTSLARLRRQYEDLAGRLESVTVRIGDAPTSANSGRTGRATLFSMEVSLAAVSAQLADLARASAETQRDRERMALDLRGEMGGVQMAVHELKGEMMALQQAHYYESASRYYAARNGQSSAVLPPPLAGSSEGKATSASSVTTSGASSSSATSAGEGTAPYPHYPGLGGYPFPPYAGLPVHMPLASSMSGQPFHSPHLPPHHAIHGSMSMRRLYGHGWPPLYPMYGAGGASPDGGMYGGGTKL